MSFRYQLSPEDDARFAEIRKAGPGLSEEIAFARLWLEKLGKSEKPSLSSMNAFLRSVRALVSDDHKLRLLDRELLSKDSVVEFAKIQCEIVASELAQLGVSDEAANRFMDAVIRRTLSTLSEEAQEQPAQKHILQITQVTPC